MENVLSANLSSNQPIQRFNWLDWMKAIGIVLIIYGHFFSVGEAFVYVFSVPLFFLISGFLCKHEEDNSVFWRKLWFNLLVPMLLICTINYAIDSVRGLLFAEHTLPENPFSFYGKVLIGIQRSLVTMWFVYTLILLKIIFQFTKKEYFHFIWLAIFVILALIINNTDIEVAGVHPFDVPWAVADTCVAYPFFIIGHFLANWKHQIADYKVNIYTFIFIVCSLAIIFFCGYHHKIVFLYNCGYGDNLFLFLIGGLAGSALVFFLSKMLDGFNLKAIKYISNGTIVILGFHQLFILAIHHIVHQKTIADFFFSIAIAFAFVPIIWLCQTYFPAIMGKYRIKKNNA